MLLTRSALDAADTSLLPSSGACRICGKVVGWALRGRATSGTHAHTAAALHGAIFAANLKGAGVAGRVGSRAG